MQNSLSLEWERQLPKLKSSEIVSIYFGGGTPSLFAPFGISKILEMIYSSGLKIDPNIEITLEANPEEVDQEFFQSIKSLGINRISLGVQSLDNRSLETLERKHSAEKAIASISDAFNAGIHNISIDLMYDIPNQTPASWDYTLKQIEKLPITHLSLYNLTLEPHTVFFKKRKTLNLPSPEISLNFYHQALYEIEKIGLKRYEISAFAKEGFPSKHNLGYWNGRPFLGFGPSAFSFWESSRFRNTSNLHRYAKQLENNLPWIDFSEKLPPLESQKELFAIALRQTCGASLPDALSHELLPKLQHLEKQGFVEPSLPFIKLTQSGLLFHDHIASELI